MNKTRNFALHISPYQKEALKRLAENSGMTLTKYVEEVLNDAVREQELYEVRAHKVTPANKRRLSAVR
jgi:predicted DNA-binding protein